MANHPPNLPTRAGPPNGQAIADLLQRFATLAGATAGANGLLDTGSYARTDYCIVHLAFSGTGTRYQLEQALLNSLTQEWDAERIANRVLIIRPTPDILGRSLAEAVWTTILVASAGVRDSTHAHPPPQRPGSAWKQGDSIAVHYASDNGDGMRFIAWIVPQDGAELPPI